MGYRGKQAEQQRARELRAQSWTLQDIATEVGVSKSSVSFWVRDVDFVPHPRRAARRRGPNKLQRAKQAEIEELLEEGRRRVGQLSEREFLMAGAALYAGEGAKRDGEVAFPNSDPRMIDFFLTWFRHFFEVDESRLRLRLYLHRGLDVDAAIQFWSSLTAIPLGQFAEPYRAEPDPTIRRTKHHLGCPSVRYCSTRVHRKVMGVVQALLSSDLQTFRGSSIGGAGPC